MDNYYTIAAVDLMFIKAALISAIEDGDFLPALDALDVIGYITGEVDEGEEIGNTNGEVQDCGAGTDETSSEPQNPVDHED